MVQGQTILIVEDEPSIAQVLRSYLEREGFAVAVAADGQEALTQFDAVSPALVLLDLMLPRLSGEEVCRAIRARGETPVIMLTAKAEEMDILAGLGIGADDYVTKPFSPRQVVARVHAVLRRARATGGRTTELRFDDGALVIHTDTRAVFRNGAEVTLTPSEYALLVTLASRPNRTFTRDELIALALKEDFEGFDRVIDTHMKNLRQKLEADAKHPRLFVTVYGVGYRFIGESK